jgi:hypothetical protein
MNPALPQAETDLLQRAAVTRRVDALFRQMSTDFLLREQFITDPTQILGEYVYGERIPPQSARAANILIYAAIGNRRLVEWFHDYAVAHRERLPSIQCFADDFANAVVEHRAHRFVLAMLGSAKGIGAVPGFDEAVLHYLLGAFIVGQRANGDTGTGTNGTGETSATTGETSATTGETSATTGETSATTGETSATTGETSATTGETGLTGATGQTGSTLTAITWSTYITAGTATGGTGTGGTGTTPFTHTGDGTRSPFTSTETRGPQFGLNPTLVVLEALAQYAFRLGELGALSMLSGQ